MEMTAIQPLPDDSKSSRDQERLFDLMHRVPVLKLEQLEEYLRRTLGSTPENVHRMVVRAAKVGRIIVSANGYVTTKEYLSMIQDEELPEPNTFSWQRYAEFHPRQRYLDEISCFWVVLNMWSKCDVFFIASDPYQLQFVTNDGKKFVQVVRIRKQDELSVPLQLSSMPWPGEDWRGSLMRIALVDSPQAANLVPHIGFSYVCVLDEERPDNLRVVQSRLGDAVWRQSESLSL